MLSGPSEETAEAAAEAVAEMDTAEKAGQILVGQLGKEGTDPASIEELNLGGVIVMGDAVPTAADGTNDVDSLKARLQETQQALSAERDWSGVIGVDQEGGLVARVQEPLTEWPTLMSYGAAATGAAGGADGAEGTADSEQLTTRGHAQMGSQLADLGFTLDFAPSVDVTVGETDPTIGARSFSSDPELVATLGRAATTGLLQAGVLPAPKHFPGHGSVTSDSHVTAPVQESSVEELSGRDWMPLEALLGSADADGSNVSADSDGSAYTPMVMMGHIIVPELEPDVPSSVSPAAYEALRDLGPGGYDGVVVTDALNMGALVERYGPDEAPVQALAAGADLLLMPSSLPGARDAVVEAVDTGEVPEDRLTEAAERVVTMLMWRDQLQEELAAASPEELAQAGVAGAGDAAGAGGSADSADEADPEQTSQEVSEAGVTMVDGTCGEPQVTDSLQITGGTAADRARLAEAAESAGLTVGSGPVVHLLGSAREAGEGDVVVALDAPFGLARSSVPADGALIALYGRTPGAFAVLVQVLTGQAEAPGALPVEVGEWPAGTGCSP
ncbi:glycoside hydrolase family 3 N-terminal domain-containing protein [Citricoccus sp. GCM10030269]|uniref:glycoside hydrolase family 3 N-terminal domain-containing protein n=1 Tax=Citricoccus sp. GCM10030269 TaxID=3273388 RepID=UPI0036064F47